MSIASVKISLIGASGTGKTHLVHKLLNKDTKEIVPTRGCEVHEFVGRLAPISYRIWDLAGEEKNKGLERGYLCGSDAVIIFYKAENKDSIANARKESAKLRSFFPWDNIAVIFCNTGEKKVRKERSFSRRKLIPSYDVDHQNPENIFLLAAEDKLRREKKNKSVE